MHEKPGQSTASGGQGLPDYCLFTGLQWNSARGLGRFAAQLRRHLQRAGWRQTDFAWPRWGSAAGRIVLNEAVEPFWREVLHPEIAIYPHNVLPSLFLSHRSLRVLVLHDVIFLEGGLRKSAGNRYRAAKLNWSLAKADLIVTVSEASRSEIVRLLPRETPVLVIPNALAEGFEDIPVSWVAKTAGPARILHFGGHAPSKNTKAVLEAIAHLRQAGHDVHLLLAAMADSAELVERWRQEARLPREALTVLPRLSDAELLRVYSEASAHCMPSTGEGFGIPVMEAARCGVPNVLSPLPVFRELLGDDATYTSGLDAESISLAVRQSLVARRDDSTRRAQARAADYSFDSIHRRHAEPTLLAIQRMAAARRGRSV